MKKRPTTKMVEDIVQTININIKLKKMNKICTNPKNYRLTLNKVYKIIEVDDDGYYFLTNDSDKVVRYDSNLFEDELQESVANPQPVAVPEIIIRTEQDCINSITVDSNGIHYTNIDNQQVSINISLSTSDTSISCGIKQIYNINSLIDNIINGTIHQSLDLILLQKQLFKSSLNYFIDHGVNECALVLISTNIEEDYEDFYDCLDELSEVVTDSVENPNSGNDIKLWVIKVND